MCCTNLHISRLSYVGSMCQAFRGNENFFSNLKSQLSVKPLSSILKLATWKNRTFAGDFTGKVNNATQKSTARRIKSDLLWLLMAGLSRLTVSAVTLHQLTVVIKLFPQLKLMSNDFLRKVWCHWTAGGLSDCYYGNNFKPFFAIFGVVEEGINLNWKNIYKSNLQKSWFSWTRYKTCADDVTTPNCRISSTISMIPNIDILMDSNEHWCCFGVFYLWTSV